MSSRHSPIDKQAPIPYHPANFCQQWLKLYVSREFSRASVRILSEADRFQRRARFPHGADGLRRGNY
jgi:hypothetical protein